MEKPQIVKAAAKLNLGLTVLARRPDGYHNLESVMQQISLADTLVFEPWNGPGWCFRCSDPALEGEDNLVCRAAQVLKEEAGRRKRLSGVRITLYKNIPVEAGLAGGSSDAAAALSALNMFWRLGLSMLELAELGARLGSDIPFCLQGGTALATGRGEKLEALPALPFFWVVLAVPHLLRLSTAAVYRSLSPDQFHRPSLQGLLAAVREKDRAFIVKWFAGGNTNTLETAVLPLNPSLNVLKCDFVEAGLHPAMSGSGPSVFALADTYPAAANAARNLQEKGYRSYLCWTVAGEEKSGREKNV